MLIACRFPGGSAGLRRDRGRLLGAAAIIGFCAVAAGPAVSENWVTLSTQGITTIAVGPMAYETRTTTYATGPMILRDREGNIIQTVKAVRPGSKIKTKLADGTFGSEVTE